MHEYITPLWTITMTSIPRPNFTALALSCGLFLSCQGDKQRIPTTVAPVLDTGSDEVFELMMTPYLQTIGTNEARIMWMTEAGYESRVNWGESDALGQHTMGTVDVEGGIGFVHNVHLVGLLPNTLYHYQSKTAGTVSDLNHFRTAPLAEDEKSFQIAAMSDMQRDDSHPDKFSEILSEGLIPHVKDRYSNDLSEALAMVLITGDLVDNGWIYTEWLDDFFSPASELMSQVPVYPVPGNHEGNTPLFFRYFHLPENATPGYEEHWWWTDYSNVRIIGLDSNTSYRTDTQLEWLESLLDETCTDTNIDFVFAQLHHPYLSELWLPGETDFTGDVIHRLEAFTDSCGKPSIHFFGHTHGYSRGQSRDHRHLWVNVASAGGALDRWGMTEQADYDEFTVSQDQYGFVVLEVEAGDDPAFTLERISRGTPESPLDNSISDRLVIRYHNTAPTPPTLNTPEDESVLSLPLTLSVGAFNDPDGDEHGASHWQVSKDCTGFTSLIVDEWQQWQNQYMGEDLNSAVVLRQLDISSLDGTGEYCWRARHRDKGLEWSEWSNAWRFSIQ